MFILSNSSLFVYFDIYIYSKMAILEENLKVPNVQKSEKLLKILYIVMSYNTKWKLLIRSWSKRGAAEAGFRYKSKYKKVCVLPKNK